MAQDNEFPMPGAGGSLPFGIFSSDDVDDGVGSELIEKLTISSRRSTSAVLSFERTHEYNPERDALMLKAFLSTTLDNETWNLFVKDVVMNSPLSHQIMQAMIANPQMAALMLGGAPRAAAISTPKIRKTRVKRVKPRTTEDSE